MLITDLDIFLYMSTLDAPVSPYDIADHFNIPEHEQHAFGLRIYRLAAQGNFYEHPHAVNNMVVTTYSIGAGASNAIAEYNAKTTFERKTKRRFVITTTIAVIGAATGLASLIWLIWSSLNPPVI